MKSTKLLGFLGEANTWGKSINAGMNIFHLQKTIPVSSCLPLMTTFFLRCVKVHNKINFYIPLNFVMTEHT